MNVVKAGAVKVLILVVAMLAAIGGWEVSKAVVLTAHGGNPPEGCPPDCPPPPPVVFDHFTCYKIHDKHPQVGFVAEVEIRNQFETSISRVKDENRLLCAPTSKKLRSLTVIHRPHDRGDDDDDDHNHDRNHHKSKGKK